MAPLPDGSEAHHIIGSVRDLIAVSGAIMLLHPLDDDRTLPFMAACGQYDLLFIE